METRRLHGFRNGTGPDWMFGVLPDRAVSRLRRVSQSFGAILGGYLHRRRAEPNVCNYFDPGQELMKVRFICGPESHSS